MQNIELTSAITSALHSKNYKVNYEKAKLHDFSLFDAHNIAGIPANIKTDASLRGYIDLYALFIEYHDPELFKELLIDDQLTDTVKLFEELRIYLISLKKYRGIRKNCLNLFKKKCAHIANCELKNKQLLLGFLECAEESGNIDNRVAYKGGLKLLVASIMNSEDFYHRLKIMLKLESKSDNNNVNSKEDYLEDSTSENQKTVVRQNTRKYSEDLAELIEARNPSGLSFNAISQTKRVNTTKQQYSVYKSYSKANDETVSARNLIALDTLRNLWSEFYQDILKGKKLNNVNLHELERKLRKHFLAFERDVSVGQLDNKKLARFIINIKHDNIFKRQTVRKQNDCCISFLLDNSGSMQGEPIAATITATYFIATILEKLGVKTEILGFTTKNWKGGQSYKDWLKGRSKAPGRVADLRHIIYKKHATNMRCQAKNLALMLKHGFLKENIDGEALQWCYRRIKNYPEQKKIILVISDGAPIEETTIKLNGDSYLENHLQQVIRNIEKDSSVKLVACGINYAIDKFYKNTIMLKNHREFNDVFFDSFLNLIK